MTNKHKLRPDNNIHVIDGSECWCCPEYMQPCPEFCKSNKDCWKCNGRGLVDVYDETMPKIVVHRFFLSDEN